MNKNRKIVALICAISMIFSLFTAFSVTVNAEEITKGIVLEYDKNTSTTTKMVVKAKYVGTDDGIYGYAVKINLPDNYKSATFATGIDAISEPTEFLDETTKVYGVSGASSKVVSSDDKLIGTFTIELNEALSAEYELALQVESSLVDAEGVELFLDPSLPAEEQLPVSTIVVPTDPKATPAPVAPERPAVNPDVTKPEVKDPVEVAKGIVLELDKASKDTVKVIKAKYVGTDDGIYGYAVKINLPDNYKSATFATGIDAISEPTEFLDETTKVYGVSGASSKVVSSDDKVIGTFTIELNEALTSDYVAELQLESSLVDAEGVELFLDPSLPAEEQLPQAWVNIPAAASSFKNEEALNKIVDSSKVGDDDAETNSPYYVVVTVKKGSEDATYGEDYVAYYAGTKLTEDQLEQYLIGAYGSVLDALNNITFEYNSGVTVSADLCKDGVKSPIDSGSTTPATPEKPTPTPAAPKINVSVSPSKVYVGDKVTVTATISGKDGEVPVLVEPLDKDSQDCMTATGIAPVLDEEGNAVAGKWTFKAALKGTVTLNFTYAYTDVSGADKVATETKTIKINEKSVGGGSSSSDDDDDDKNNNGPIAGGTTTTPSTGALNGGITKFNDLDTVPWAQQAITILAAKGIVNGRDASTFDPNANITRAEYCQILVGAIGKTQEAADSNFADVDTNAWYYHAVSVASSYGIVSGYGDGNFGPNNLITRRDMALMTMKAAQVMGVNLSAVRTMSFADADQFDYAADAVNTLANAGIINGVSDTEFAPMANATRAQAAKIIFDTFVK